jgi:signal peptidase I
MKSAGRILAALAAVVVLAFVMRSSFVATYRIIGPSMLPTLEIGDRVLVNRLAYGLRPPFSKTRMAPKEPRRGELVVFRAHGLAGTQGAQSVVKRVLGVPGDRLTFEDGDLHINGWLVPYCDAGPYIKLDGRLIVRGRLTVEYLGDSTYLTVRNAREPRYADYVVQPGEVYVVGDDRGVSSDSRLWSDRRGTGVPMDILEGRVSRVLFGARPDGRLDFSRLLSPPLDLKVRVPGFDMSKTDERINRCLSNRPAVTSPPSAG